MEHVTDLLKNEILRCNELIRYVNSIEFVGDRKRIFEIEKIQKAKKRQFKIALILLHQKY